ncbi:MAG: HD domain-containing protein [Gammaproteobacteria bacterium]
MKTPQYYVIKDPVHGIMQFTATEQQWIKPFIDHGYFQRLRHIKQSGLADLIFPGAVHTRFNHSLGCCYLASQISNKLGLADEDRQLVMIACLLHDIGHGPFSHAFEFVFHNKAIVHEQWTPLFLNEFNHEAFFKEYNAINPDFPLNEEKLDRIKRMIMHEERENLLLADIVSSQLDADRLDYLLRDSHFCGVQYGEFDLRWMLHCLTVVDTEHGKRLGVTDKGVGVVEHYLMARRLMRRNIYHHHKKYAIENFLVKFLQHLAVEIQRQDFLRDIKHSSLGQLLLNIQAFNESAKIDAATREAFLIENYDLYKRLCDYHVLQVIAELAESSHQHDLVELAKRIHYRRLPEVFPVSSENVDEINSAVKAFKARNKKTLRDWQIEVLKTPHLSYTGSDDPIYVLEKTGSVKRLHDLSLMIHSLSDQYEHGCSIFIDGALVNEPLIAELFESIAE